MIQKTYSYIFWIVNPLELEADKWDQAFPGWEFGPDYTVPGCEIDPDSHDADPPSTLILGDSRFPGLRPCELKVK